MGPQELSMKIRILGLGLACALCLCAQKRFSWQEACFKNPRLPYCQGHESAVKHTKDEVNARGRTTGVVPSMLDNTIDAGGIDWRFADPSADALAVLKCGKLAGSPAGRALIEQLGANQGLDQEDVRTSLRALTGADQVALSVRGGGMVFMISGRMPGSILPAPDAGWKAVPLEGNTILIGHADAVDQAVKRMLARSPLGEFAQRALERQADGEFWAVGSAKLAGQEAMAAGVKRFTVAASMGDRLTSDTAFEFGGVPDATAIQTWLSTLGEAKIEGNVVHARMSTEAGGMHQRFGTIAGSPLGQRLGAFIGPARYFPMPDDATTKHSRPVIYGLDEGAKEVKQYVPAAFNAPAPDSPAPASPGPIASGVSGTWAFTHADGRFQGVVEFRQNGSAITGTWHTTSRAEADSAIAGRIDGNTVTFTRFVGSNQNFVLTLSADGSRLDGFGEGWFLNHSNLNMQRAVATVGSAYGRARTGGGH